MEMQTAGKLHQESSVGNRAFDGKCVNGRITPPERKLVATSQCKVKSKNEITIGNKCRYWAADLLKQYDQPVPGWLRSRFIITQLRRKLLNEWLWEANVVEGYCDLVRQSDEWDYHLHCLWHIVNGGVPCK